MQSLQPLQSRDLACHEVGLDESWSMHPCDNLPSNWLATADDLMSPYGIPFSDAADVERLSGRPFEEFQICRIEVSAWRAIGTIRASYRNTLDGQVIRCPRRGRMGDFAGEMILSPGEWITDVAGLHGVSATCADGVYVDRLNLISSDGVCAQLTGCGGYGPDTVLLKSHPQNEDGLVVRAIEGRCSSSVNGVRFIVGPRIPSVWSPDSHSRFPARTRRAVLALLMLSRRKASECLFGLLDRDAVMLVAQLSAKPHSFLA